MLLLNRDTASANDMPTVEVKQQYADYNKIKIVYHIGEISYFKHHEIKWNTNLMQAQFLKKKNSYHWGIVNRMEQNNIIYILHSD